MDQRTISFGPFRLVRAQRLLLEGDTPVRLGSRAFDILAALVERRGEVVGKEELIHRAWPQTFVEEANLRIQINALRRALGDGQRGHRYIVTVPGRGYAFAVPAKFDEPSRSSQRPPPAPMGVHNLPLAVTRMIGREEAVGALVRQLPHQRFVTIVGPGGIGKTTLALAVADRMIATYEDGVWLIDLAPLADPRLVPSAVATVLGLEIGTEDPLPGLVAGLKDRRLLLLLDSCEHVIDVVAALATAGLGGVPGLNILATSREPLRAAGEREYRLGPLASPPRSVTSTAAQAAVFPAVQLFVERVGAVVEDFTLTDENALKVVEICRRLDGLPLAIEFAAPCVAAFGLDGLTARLDDTLPLLAAERRAATPRHRTMRAVVDWSYDLLSAHEQPFFRALGIFSGGFTVEAATVIAGDTKTHSGAMDRMADLVSKSLVVADVSGAEPRFRLLDTTRAYAIEKLNESGERERIARRHADHYRRVFERADDETALRPTSEWLVDYAPEIDNLRTALDWSFSPGGDRSIGVSLAAAATSLLLRLSLHVECRSRANQALAAAGSITRPDPRDEMRLHAALGTASPDPVEVDSGFTKAFDIAERIGDLEYRLRGLAGRFFGHTASGQHRTALPFAQQFHDLAMRKGDPGAQLFGEHVMGVAAHFLGDQAAARRHLEQVLTHYAGADQRRGDVRLQNAARFQIDAEASTHTFHARALWLQGLSDQAVRAAAMTVEKAQASGHALSLCYALALGACPIALWVGDLAGAALYTEMLLDRSRRHNLPLWGAYGSRFQRALLLRDSDAAAGIRRYDVVEFTRPDSNFQFFTSLGELAQALLHARRITEALSLMTAGIERSEADWLMPELLRLKGEALLSQSTSASGQAEHLFRQALERARRQDALSWELRAATSLARLLRDDGRSADAIACLRPVHERFTEGFATTDLIAATRFLDSTPGAQSSGHRAW